MSFPDVVNAVLFGASAFLAAYAALTIIVRRATSRSSGGPTSGDLFGDTLIFLIRDGQLADCNFAAQRLLRRFGGRMEDADILVLRRALNSLFEDAAALTRPMDARERTALSRDGQIQCIAQSNGPVVRLKIASLARIIPSAEDIHCLAAQSEELETLRETVDSAPYLVWREAPDGTPVWVNRAYLERVRSLHGDARAVEWPLPRLFPALRRGEPRRLSLAASGTASADWFECHATAIGRDTLGTAFDANATVHAERQLRDFMQTLTKTFSQLDVGLAIFDKSRNLALFNPALTDLTRLPVEFLASRPSLFGFLDRLRETRMVPEPKDYRSWRQSITDLEAAAVDGVYSETWSLPDNLTYRITGRPHPDGAIAFLLEDISAEISSTRQFRRELEVSQTLLDNMSEATVLFSQSGALMQTNRAYRLLWGVDTDSTVTRIGVADASRIWHEKTVPTPVWGDVRDFVLDQLDRVEWTATVTLRDGRRLLCRFVPLPGGATQAVFRLTGERAIAGDALLEVV